MMKTPADEELDLLASYADGPRIWDAAAVMPVVFRLLDKGLIEPHSSPSCFKLTSKGREVLKAVGEA